jgi:hypothetical protein
MRWLWLVLPLGLLPNLSFADEAGARHNGASGERSPPRKSLLWRQVPPRVFMVLRARGEKNIKTISA